MSDIGLTKLAERGILDAALELGWHPNGTGWQYPVWADMPDGTPITRFKNYDSHATKKYLWNPEGTKEFRPQYYCPPDAPQAIAEHGGELYIASGEPDVLAYRSAGFKHVICWFGEGATPKSLADDLREAGVTRVFIYPDLDETGARWAATIMERLAKTNIEVNCYRLPFDMLGEKGDINKLWVAAGCDKDAFTDLLLECEPYTPEMPEELPLLRESVAADKPKAHDDLPQGFYDAVAARLPIKGYKPTGWSKEFACPLKHHEHDDKQPSASWHKDKKILSCFKCARTEVMAVEVGEALNLDWHDYIEKPSVVPPAPADPSQPAKSAIVRWQSAASVVRKEARGELDGSLHESLPIPFKNLHRFGGMAVRLQPRKLLAIVGDSGDGKTSLTETIVDFWRQKGFSGLMWGPEWGPEEYVYRAIQRCSGPNIERMLENRDWWSGHLRGETGEAVRGSRLTDAELALLDEKLAEIGAWPGGLYFIDQAGGGMAALLQKFDEGIEAAKAEGKRVSFVAVDYAQLLSSGDDTKIEAALGAIKEYVGSRDLVGIVGSQVRKSDGRSGASGDRRIDHHSMQYARSDKFNLALAINRQINPDTGEKSEAALIRVAKNSLGKLGDTGLWLDAQRLRWGDMDMQHVDLSNFWHDYWGDPEESEA